MQHCRVGETLLDLHQPVVLAGSLSSVESPQLHEVRTGPYRLKQTNIVSFIHTIHTLTTHNHSIIGERMRKNLRNSTPGVSPDIATESYSLNSINIYRRFFKPIAILINNSLEALQSVA